MSDSLDPNVLMAQSQKMVKKSIFSKITKIAKIGQNHQKWPKFAHPTPYIDFPGPNEQLCPKANFALGGQIESLEAQKSWGA